MRVACWQFDVLRGEPQQNLASIEAGSRAAHEQGAALLVLPEMWASSFPGPSTDVAAAVEQDARAIEQLARWSAQRALALCGSTFGRATEALPRNRWSLAANGRVLAHYDKVHLFSPTAETESFSAGDAPPPTVALADTLVSGIVCYDLRFPELTRHSYTDGAELVCISAQWPVARASQWRALVIGLAVQNQCAVAACNRTGVDVLGRRELRLEFPGQSLIVDARGVVLAEGDRASGLVIADVDLDEVRELRRRVPVRRDARPELYRSWSGDVERT
jgi:predicted amidohydrolase